MSRPTCKGCGAIIRWIRTRTGAPAPVDPERRSEYVTDAPALTSRRVTLVDPDGDTHSGYLASVTTPGAREISGYVSHFGTCPQAARFRRAKEA